MNDSLNRFFDVGVVAGRIGLKGEVKVFPLTDEPKRFELLSEVHVSDGVSADFSVLKIEKTRFHKNLVILKFEGVDDQEQAQLLKGRILKIPPSLALPLSDGQYFHRDLLDMSVFTEDGAELGVLTKIIPTGANDVYSVTRKCPSGVKNKELLIPAIKSCILNVDVENKRMTVRLLPGLSDV